MGEISIFYIVSVAEETGLNRSGVNLEDRFSSDEAHIIEGLTNCQRTLLMTKKPFASSKDTQVSMLYWSCTI